jgi:putative MATE family efflux protein
MSAPGRAKVGARFTTGSTMSHVVVMTFTSAIGLMAMFMVDLIDLWFITMLDIIEATAAIGFAGTIVFSNLSVGLGMSIAGGALVAQALGRGDEDGAQQAASSTLVLTLATGVLVAILVGIFARPLLSLLGAAGETLEIARSYLLVILPGFALLAGAITLSFTLRALGDPTRAMYVTLTTAAANAVLDPIFIFSFGLGVEGAALATVCANLASFAVGFYCLQKHHGFLVMPTLESIRTILRPLSRIAFPAIATQLATPFSIAYLTAVTAQFGTDAVAGVAVINRLIPVAFGIIFSLSGAVGPVVGQNYGAGQLDRVRQTLHRRLQVFHCLRHHYQRHHAAPCRPAAGLVQRNTGSSRAGYLLLHLHRHHLGVCRHAVCLPGGVQQPRQGLLVDVVQLGQGHHRHHSAVASWCKCCRGQGCPDRHGCCKRGIRHRCLGDRALAGPGA